MINMSFCVFMCVLFVLPCRQYLVVVFRDKPLELWDVRTGTLLREMAKNFPSVTALVMCVCAPTSYYEFEKTVWKPRLTQQRHRLHYLTAKLIKSQQFFFSPTLKNLFSSYRRASKQCNNMSEFQQISTSVLLIINASPQITACSFPY